LKALRAALAEPVFQGHERRATDLLDVWDRLDDHRIYLAHGRSKFGDEQVTMTIRVHVHAADKPSPKVTYTRASMRKVLEELNQTCVLLEAQLGQIRAASGRQNDEVKAA